MGLDERKRSLGALYDILHLPSALADNGLAVHIHVLASLRQIMGAVGISFNADFLSYDNVVVEAHRQTDYTAQHYLQNELSSFAHAFLVVLEHLYIIIGETDSAAPYSGENQQLSIYVGQVAEKQGGHQDGKQDDDTAHSRGALLLHLTFESEIANRLANLLFLKPSDDSPSGEERYQHCRNECKHRSE